MGKQQFGWFGKLGAVQQLCQHNSIGLLVLEKLSGSKTFACRRGQLELLDDGKCSFDDEAREMLFVLYRVLRGKQFSTEKER